MERFENCPIKIKLKVKFLWFLIEISDATVKLQLAEKGKRERWEKLTKFENNVKMKGAQERSCCRM